MKMENECSPLETNNISTTEPQSPRKPATFIQEQPPQVMEVAPTLLRHRTRRDLLLFGASAIAAVAAGSSLLPETTLERLRHHSWKQELAEERMASE